MLKLAGVIDDLRANLKKKVEIGHALSIRVFTRVGRQRCAKRDIKFKFLIGKGQGTGAALLANGKHLAAINDKGDKECLSGFIICAWICRTGKPAAADTNLPERLGQFSGTTRIWQQCQAKCPTKGNNKTHRISLIDYAGT